MNWIKCSKKMPPNGLEVLVWCAESRHYQGGTVLAIHNKNGWECDAERFEDTDTQDPDVFVTHWTPIDAARPDDVPSAEEIAILMGEEACAHGLDTETIFCEECVKFFAEEELKKIEPLDLASFKAGPKDQDWLSWLETLNGHIQDLLGWFECDLETADSIEDAYRRCIQYLENGTVAKPGNTSVLTP